jgi:UDP-glucose 4-epimerase
MGILITGGAGFIGKNLAAHLSESGHRVQILDNFATSSRPEWATGLVKVFEGSVLNYDQFLESASDVETIVHLAALPSVGRSWQNPIESNLVNTQGTINACLVALEVGAQLVFASSSSVYGSNPLLPRNESHSLMPISPYAVTKLIGEEYIRMFMRTKGLSATILRFFNVYGPGQSSTSDYAAVIPKFITGALSRSGVSVFGDGEQSRDFTYVADLCRVIERVIDLGISQELAINAAFGESYSLNLVLEILRRNLGAFDIEYFPSRVGDVRESQADPSELYRRIGALDVTSFEAGLSSTIEYFRGAIQD